MLLFDDHLQGVECPENSVNLPFAGQPGRAGIDRKQSWGLIINKHWWIQPVSATPYVLIKDLEK